MVQVCFPPLTALDVVTSRVQASVLVVGTRPALRTRPGVETEYDDGEDDEAATQHMEAAVAAIGNAVVRTVERLTGSRAVVRATPVGGDAAAAAAAWPTVGSGTRRLQLVDTAEESAAAAAGALTSFDAVLDVSSPASGEGDGAGSSGTRTEAEAAREAAYLVDALATVTAAAMEVYDLVAHGEHPMLARVGPDAQPAVWAGIFVEALYAKVDETVRAEISAGAIAEVKNYHTPPEAVLKILAAAIALLSGLAGVPRFDRVAQLEWKSVRVLLDERLIKALAAFEPSNVHGRRWALVTELLEGVTVRDAMRSSGPLAALFRWIKAAGLLADREQLIQPAAQSEL